MGTIKMFHGEKKISIEALHRESDPNVEALHSLDCIRLWKSYTSEMKGPLREMERVMARYMSARSMEDAEKKQKEREEEERETKKRKKREEEEEDERQARDLPV